MHEWEVYQANYVAAWLDQLQADDPRSADLVDDAIYALSCSGPAWGRPLVDLAPALQRLQQDAHSVRFDPWRSAILLVAGNKAGRWSRWYAEFIPLAEQLYETYLKERAEEEAGR